MSPARYLFISDLHLDATVPEAVAQFLQFLRGEAHEADALYILGDLFESWIGDDDEEPVRSAVCAALLEYTARETPCYVMRGNRDFLLGPRFEHRSGCRLLPDPVLLEAGDLRVILSHGDVLCTDDKDYQRFRQFTRRPGVQRRFLALPRPTRRALASAARAGSRAHTQGMPERIMDVTPDAVTALLRAGAADLLIHGHTHRPAVHELQVDGRKATRIVLGDWYEQGSALAVYTDARYETLSLPGRAAGSTLNMAASSSRV